MPPLRGRRPDILCSLSHRATSVDMSKYHDDRTAASDPAHICVSDEKLRRFHPELYGWKSWVERVPFGPRRMWARQLRTMLNEHVQLGDSRAAIVAQLSPLVVAAYTDEQDAVVLLKFPAELVSEYRLQPGNRLLTTNTYFSGPTMAHDIIEGSESTGRWANFYPIIAEFVSDDIDAIERRKSGILPAEWQRATALARQCIAQSKVLIRDGRPLHSLSAATSHA